MAFRRGYRGWVAGWLLAGLRRPRVRATDLAQAEFKTSTQRLGVRFTDRVRDVFRFRWIRRTP
ncbi:MAG: hypothetical protein KBE04_06485 [Phycisphaerae bacterium]|nr:hypothetical protein [Phycisphaerae bacterium]